MMKAQQATAPLDEAVADDNGIGVLYVSGGIHAREYGDVDNPDPAALAAFLEAHGRRPVAVIPRLK